MKINWNRTIYMGDETGEDDAEQGVNASMAHRVIKGLALIKGTSSITLVLNSFGGCDDNSRAIIDAIENDSRDIIGVVFGRAESAMAWILQSCDWRVMMPRSNLMLHLGTSDKNAHSEWGDKMFVDDVLRRMQQKDPSYPRNKLVKNLKSDYYVYPTQAQALGLCDEIGGLK